MLFYKSMDQLSQIESSDNSYVLYDNDPLFLKYIPPPNDKQRNQSSQCSQCAALFGGIVHSILTSAGFPCQVEVQTPPQDGQSKYPTTAFVIDFDESVLEREKLMK